jgi:hypothetical protein
LRALTSAFVIFFIVVSIDDHNIDSINGFVKIMPGLHPKPDGEVLECYCGDPCKINASGDYKILWQWLWMCDNLAYDPEPGDTEVRMCKISDCIMQSHIKYLMMSCVKFVFLLFCSMCLHYVIIRCGST